MNPKYFTYLELVRTDTGLPNGPTEWQQVVNLQRIAFFLAHLAHAVEEYMDRRGTGNRHHRVEIVIISVQTGLFGEYAVMAVVHLR